MTGDTIARALRLHRVGKGRWEGQCPSCGYRGGFAVTDRQDGLPLIYCHAGGCSQTDLMTALRRLGLWPDRQETNAGAMHKRRRDQPARRAASADPPSATQREAARSIWCRTSSVDDVARSLVAEYLRRRGYSGPIPTVLREMSEARHPSGNHAPAMVALVQHVIDGPVAVHRTFLAADGSGKADLKPVKMSLGPCKGAAVQLAPAGPTLAVAEGIETALSYMHGTGIPTWAALSAVGIRNLVLPPSVIDVIIATDPDPVGILAANAAARRWLGEGRRVSIARPPLGLDFNDLVRGGVA